MKKLLTVFCALFMCASIWAQITCATCTIKVEADATVHTGAAPGDPAGYIDPGTGKLDVSGMAAGSLLCFNISLENTDFTLAGFQFQLNYPSILTKLSENAADWAAGTGAVAVAGAFIPAGANQGLPATAAGALVAATPAQNGGGQFPIGNIITDPPQRPGAGAGGVILRVWIEWKGLDALGDPTCTSGRETLRIPIGVTFTGPADDLFADDLAQRVTVGTADIEVEFGDDSQWVRSDFTKNGIRDALDALGSALCSLNGQPTCTGWDGDPAAEFVQAFDHNCDAVVDALDALPNALKCLGLQNRNQSKTTNYIALEGNGTLSLMYENRKGAMASATIKLDGVKAGAPYISQAAKDEGWVLVHGTFSSHLQYIALNTKGVNTAIPMVQIDYEPMAKTGRMAVVDTAHQSADFSEFTYMPQVTVDTNGSMAPGKVDKESRKK